MSVHNRHAAEESSRGVSSSVFVRDFTGQERTITTDTCPHQKWISPLEPAKLVVEMNAFWEKIEGDAWRRDPQCVASHRWARASVGSSNPERNAPWGFFVAFAGDLHALRELVDHEATGGVSRVDAAALLLGGYRVDGAFGDAAGGSNGAEQWRIRWVHAFYAT